MVRVKKCLIILFASISLIVKAEEGSGLCLIGKDYAAEATAFINVDDRENVIGKIIIANSSPFPMLCLDIDVVADLYRNGTFDKQIVVFRGKKYFDEAIPAFSSHSFEVSTGSNASFMEIKNVKVKIHNARCIDAGI